jgi:hypothetical protein
MQKRIPEGFLFWKVPQQNHPHDSENSCGKDYQVATLESCGREQSFRLDVRKRLGEQMKL